MGSRTQRGGVLAWLVITVLGLVTLSAIVTSCEDRSRLAQAERAAAAAAVAKKVEADKLKASCIARRGQLLEEIAALVQQKRFGAAFAQVNECAQATGDTDLGALAAKARIADLRDTMENTKNGASARMWALEALVRDYPNELDDRTKRLQVQLQKLQAAESAAETRRLAAEKRRKGVSIGMSQQDVLDSSWGRPRKVNRSTYSWGTHEQWVYDGGYLYFKDGVLDSIQN